MVDAVLAWLFGLNPALVWFGGGLVCGSIYLVAVPDSDDARENRDRAMVAGALVIMWPSVLIWLGPVFLAVRVARPTQVSHLLKVKLLIRVGARKGTWMRS